MEPMIEKAKNAAEKVMGHRFRHGCVIEKNGKVISTGFNKKVNHPILLSFGYKNKWPHAESDAILRAWKMNKSLKGAHLLVVRKSKNKLSNSKPCSCCLKFMIAAGISEVSYSTTSGTIEKKMIKKNG